MADMDIIYRTPFGSALYGTQTPQSDVDYKSIYLPDARSILLGKVKPSISLTPQTEGKNEAGQEDEECWSLHKFLSMCAGGQMVALDVLFSYMAHVPGKISTHYMRDIWENRHRLLTKNVAGIFGYMRSQVNKYGVKGSRVAAAEKALDTLLTLQDEFPSRKKLGELEWHLRLGLADVENVEFVDITPRGQDTPVTHLSVCGKKAAFTAPLKDAVACYQKLVDDYGARAKAARDNEGVDWKAIHHAYRVGTQALELLETGHITFPLPNAAFHVQVKEGLCDFQAMAERIEELFERVEEAAEKSGLPEQADWRWIDDFVMGIYFEQCDDYYRAMEACL